MKTKFTFLAIASLFLCALAFSAPTNKMDSISGGAVSDEGFVRAWKVNATASETPTKHCVKIETVFERKCRVKLAVSDFTSGYLYVRTVEVDPGSFEAEIPTKDLAKGSYLLLVTRSGDKVPLRKVFVKK